MTLERACVVHRLSGTHLYAAYEFGNSAGVIEQESTQTQESHLRHQCFVTASILSSVAFLEACVNEFYAACAETPSHIPNRANPGYDCPGCIRADTIRLIGALWQIEGFGRKAKILEKFQTALRLAGQPQFPLGSNPYQDAKLVVQLRNKLVHFRPELVELATSPGNPLPPDRFEAAYRSKFHLNPIAPRIEVGDSDGSVDELGHAFFPTKCLGHGCAGWAFRSVLAFANEFFRRLSTTWYYHWLFWAINDPHVTTRCGVRPLG